MPVAFDQTYWRDSVISRKLGSGHFAAPHEYDNFEAEWLDFHAHRMQYIHNIKQIPSRSMNGQATLYQILHDQIGTTSNAIDTTYNSEVVWRAIGACTGCYKTAIKLKSIPPGRYHVTGSFTTAYSPMGDRYCVRSCIEQCLYGNQDTNYVHSLFGELMNTDEIIASCKVLGLNFILVHKYSHTTNSSVGILYKLRALDWAIALLITTSGIHKHCSVGTGEITKYKPITASTIAHIDNANAHNNYVPKLPVSYAGMQQWLSAPVATHNLVRLDIRPRMQAGVWRFVLDTLKYPFIHGDVALTGGNEYCMINVNTRDMESMMLHFTGDHWQLCHVIISNRVAHVNTLGHLNTIGMLINLRYPIGTPAARKLTIAATDEYMALNQITLKHCNSVNTGYVVSKIADLGAKYIVVQHYDNRGHHLRDERSIIANATLVTWLGEPIVDYMNNELNATHGQCIRLMYYHGNWRYTNDTSNECIQSHINQIVDHVVPFAPKGVTLPGCVINTPHSQSIPPLTEMRTMYNCDGVHIQPLKQITLGVTDWAKLRTMDDYMQEIPLKPGFVKVLQRSFCTTRDKEQWKFNRYFYSVDCANGHAYYLREYGAVVEQYLLGSGQAVAESVQLWPMVEEPALGTMWHATKTNAMRQDDWWQLTKVKPPKSIHYEFADINAWNEVELIDSPSDMVFDLSTLGIESNSMYLPPLMLPIDMITETTQQITRMDVMMFWDDTDLTLQLNRLAPTGPMRIRTREMGTNIITTTKYTLAPYPICAYPVHPKKLYGEFNAMTQRLGSVYKVRRNTPDCHEVIQLMIKAYFKQNCNEIINTYLHDIISIDGASTRDWISKRNNTGAVMADLDKWLTGSIMWHNMADAKIHNKSESLYKMGGPRDWKMAAARSIVWHSRGVAALYAPVFIKAKDRLKCLLRDKVTYTDGLRPHEMSAAIRLCENVNCFFENDLEKQDRQTDAHIIKVEMQMYKSILGVSDSVLSSWGVVHGEWQVKSNINKSTRQYMRKTGEVTTALGNVITNMQAHAKFVFDNYQKIERIFMVGDDNLMVCNGKPFAKGLKEYIATNFNMRSKENLNAHVADYCCFLVYKTWDGRAEMGPNIVRMRHKYELTSGKPMKSNAILKLKSMSYCMMLGNTPEVQSIIQDNKWPIQPLDWYDMTSAIKANAIRHEMTEMEVHEHYALLIQMMRHNTTYAHEFRYYLSGDASAKQKPETPRGSHATWL
jgi:hypothetical protein